MSSADCSPTCAERPERRRHSQGDNYYHRSIGMNAFLLGILSSLVTSALLLALSFLRASRPLWWLTAACSWFTGTGLRRVYRRQSAAEHNLREHLI